MASDRQRFWWRLDAALRSMAIGGSLELSEGPMRAWVDSLPGRDGKARWRLYIEERQIPPPPPVESVSDKAHAIFGAGR